MNDKQLEYLQKIYLAPIGVWNELYFGLQRLAWMPIEEAEHDKIYLLGWRHWNTGEWECEVGKASDGQRVGYTSTISHHGSATHFMPLPPTPKDD